VHAIGGRIDGDIVRGGIGRLDVNLVEGAWHGRGSRLTALSLESAVWTLTDNSDVDTVRLERGGRIDIGGGHPAFRTLRVGSWHAEAAAAGIVLGTRLDAGGPLRRQATDRLLVSGDAVGRTALHVTHVGGQGADTAGRDGANGSGNGISVVQVAGTASAESFHLAGDYVAVGPWQYRLHAFGPGASDPAQRLVAGSGGYWDYRLQSVRIGSNARAALVPQVPAYLVLGHALFGYGRTAIDALRPAGVSPSDAPVLRVRTFGGNVMYRGAPRAVHGIAYRRVDRGLQVMGDLLVHHIGDTTLRTGASLSTGKVRATPRTADGRSDLRAAAQGIAWHAVLTDEGRWEIASFYAHTRYRIDVHTPSRGQVLPRMRATTDEAMVSTDTIARQPTRRWCPPPFAGGRRNTCSSNRASHSCGSVLTSNACKTATASMCRSARLVTSPFAAAPGHRCRSTRRGGCFMPGRPMWIFAMAPLATLARICARPESAFPPQGRGAVWMSPREPRSSSANGGSPTPMPRPAWDTGATRSWAGACASGRPGHSRHHVKHA